MNLQLIRPLENHEYADLAYHIVDSCTLACEGCQHWTDVYDLKNIADVSTFKEEASYWLERITNLGYCYDSLTVLGGEPLLHPRLMDIIEIAIDLTKNLPTKAKIVTNGQLFHKHPKLWDFVLSQDPKDFILRISLHTKDKEYIKKYLGPYKKEIIKYYSLVNDHTLIFCQASKNDHWRSNRSKTQKNSLISPYKIVDPIVGYKEMGCQGLVCHQIYNNNLWKCPNLAYMPLEKVDQTFRDLYNSYTPIGVESSDKELKEFLLQQEIPACAGCGLYTRNNFKVLDNLDKKTYIRREYTPEN